MNELLFLPADAPSHLGRLIASKVGSSPLARRLVTFTAAVLVNLAVLGTLQHSAETARYAPPGEVVITQLDPPPEVRLARK
jgi:hypothetical protein